MNTYLVFEIGNSAYTEFKIASGEYVFTEDAILIARVNAKSKQEAYIKAISLEQNIQRVFDNLIIEEIIT